MFGFGVFVVDDFWYCDYWYFDLGGYDGVVVVECD